jgi:hypothetical protein
MTMAAIHYRENPTVTVKRCTKTIQAAKADLDNKTAYLANEISLDDYLYAQASNVVFIPYLDQETLDENALIDAQLNLNLDSNDGFKDIEDVEEEKYPDTGALDQEQFDPLLNVSSRYSQNTASNNDTSSLMPEYTTMTTCNSDLNESTLIREAEGMEKLLFPSK